MSMLLLLDDIPLSALVRAMFANNEQGFWYDLSDFSTLFQDAAGTTPVTALGQGVGLMLDKRLGLVLGSELVSNGTFDSGITGWSAVGGASVAWNSSGAIDVTRVSASGDRSSTPITCASGRMYKVSVSVSAGTGFATAWIGTTPAGSVAAASQPTSGAAETFTFIFSATAASMYISLGNSSNGTRTFDNISVRELPGNHAYQTTSASRPTVQSPYISFDKTADHLLVAAGGAGTTGILLAVGIMAPAAGTARTIWSDLGTNTGYRLSIDATNKVTFSGGTGAGYTTLTSAGALTAGTKYILMAWHDGTNLNLSINNVAETPVALGTVTAGTASFTVGKDNGAASGYWGDRLYQMVYRKNDASNATQRNNVFAYIRQMMQGL